MVVDEILPLYPPEQVTFIVVAISKIGVGCIIIQLWLIVPLIASVTVSEYWPTNNPFKYVVVAPLFHA